ncbi:MAG: hypothetical protein JXB30_18795 [Anaerolineae bacterium]|nr:hypothetical protein [Anaerolineae bacterium]
MQSDTAPTGMEDDWRRLGDTSLIDRLAAGFIGALVLYHETNRRIARPSYRASNGWT